MCQTLLYVPSAFYGIPLFGGGLLLALWALGSVVLMAVLVKRQGLNAETLSYVPLVLLIGAALWLVLPHLCEDLPGSWQHDAFRTSRQIREGLPAQGLPIRGYGVMLLLGVLAAVGLAAWRARRAGMDPEWVYALAFWAIIPGIIGARAFHVIEYWFVDYWPVYQTQGLAALMVALVNVAKGGLVVYGSLVGGLFGILLFVHRRRLPPLATLDLITPSMVLGLAIGRLGCFLNGCCFGGVCELSCPLAVHFPAGSLAYYHQLEHGQAFLHGLKLAAGKDGQVVIVDVEPGSGAAQQGLKPGDHIMQINGIPLGTPGEPVDQAIQGAIRILLAVDRPGEEIRVATTGGVARWRTTSGPPRRSLPVHPTQLYSSVNALLLCLFLLAYDPFRRRDGELWALLLSIYPVARFLLEMIRTDEEKAFGGLTIAQVISLLLLAGAAVFWFYLRRKPPGVAFPVRRP